jgi:hypothetical protein
MHHLKKYGRRNNRDALTECVGLVPNDSSSVCDHLLVRKVATRVVFHCDGVLP